VDKDDRALSQIILGVKTHHPVTTSTCTTSKQAWDSLEQAFSWHTSAQRAQLQMVLTRIRKKAGEDLTMYSSRAKSIKAELESAGQLMDDNKVILYALRRLIKESEIIKPVLKSDVYETLAPAGVMRAKADPNLYLW